MRLAVVVAPSDPRSGDAVARREALARLRGQLARMGFDVIIAGGGQDPTSALEKAAARVTPGDSLFVHLSGRLVDGNVLAFGGGRSLPLRTVAQALAAREPADLAFVAELMRDEPTAGDAAMPVVEALSRPWGDSVRGSGHPERATYSVLVAVRPLAAGLPRLAFTERLLATRESGAPAPLPDALVAGMHERALADAEIVAAGQGLGFAAPGEFGSPSHFPSADAAPAQDVGEIASDRIDLTEDEPVEPVSLQPAHDAPVQTPPAAALPPLPAPAQSGTALAGAGADSGWLDSPSLVPPLVAASATGAWADEAPRVEDTTEVDTQIANATSVEDWKRVLDLRLSKLAVLEDPSLQVKELIAMARLLQAHLADSEGALKSLEQAREIEPERASVLRALRRGYETMGRWASAMEVIGVLAEMAIDPAERAALRVAQATIAFDRLGDEGGAETWVHAALADDASNKDALALLQRLRAVAEPDAMRAPEPSAIDLPIDDMEEDAPDASHVPSAWSAAAGVEYGDGFAAAEASADAAQALPSFAELEALIARDPLDANAYRQIHARYLQDGNTDAAYLAAMSLEELRASDLNQQGLVDHFRSVSPVRARASLDAAAWDLLRAPGYDDVLAAIFVAAGRAAIEVRIEDLYEQRRAAAPDRERRLGEASTASVVRGFQWAARFLGMTCPDLYVVEQASGCTTLPAVTPSTALGPDVLSGQSAKELAFLAGYHLTRYRAEYRVLSFYTTREDITMLLFAAAQLGMPSGPSGVAGSVGSLRARLSRLMNERERVALAAAVSRLDARGGQATVGAWMRSLELTAARVGLLLSGDLATASALVASPLCTAQEPHLDGRRGDLIAFCASPAHAELRARFVTSSGSSVRSTDNLSSFSHGA